MTGKDLRELIFNKWGYCYDVQLIKIKDKIYFQVMWKYLEQASFHWTESEYAQHLEQVANYITSWGVINQVENGILEAKSRPRLGKAVSISLDLGDRTSEWIL
ncbi:DUF3067 family protein [Geminocystis sp. NIES-3709]|uniref:DUF3067 family protein n=1 Tax=Geminocystis sp. NIES-3709 TaxID=1617448 RepID=UPI0005FCAE32|nr:DUF3067 family protein [Geminocystis sp. NIES-3709]BAQ64502.1 expressed protein [Geminocystis sp. NIES-3709]